MPKRLRSPCRDRNIARAFGVIHRVREDIHDRVLGSAFLQKERNPYRRLEQSPPSTVCASFRVSTASTHPSSFLLMLGQEPAVPPVFLCSPVGKSAGQVYLDISPPWKQQWDFKCVHTDLIKKIII